jgi:hypothetical protein
MTMAMQTIHDITSGPDDRLHVTYTDGVAIIADIRPMIERGGVFAPLADPAEFAKVSVGARGRYIEWPSGADLCADALRAQGEPKPRAHE